MKNLIVLFLVLPYTLLAQEHKHALTLAGGLESYMSPLTRWNPETFPTDYTTATAKKYAWNIELNKLQTFRRNRKISFEFGINFNHQEYQGEEAIIQDSIYFGSNQSIPSVKPGYITYNYMENRSTSAIRLHAGINHTIIEKNKLNASLGLNVSSQIALIHKESGKTVDLPIAPNLIDYQESKYAEERNIFNSQLPVFFQFQPHIDIQYQCTSNLWISSRFSYYALFTEPFKFAPAQINIGIQYRWFSIAK